MKSNFYLLKKLFAFLLAGMLLEASAPLQAQSVCSTPNTLFGLDNNGLIYSINPATAVSGSAINTASYTSIGSYTAVTAGQTLGANSANGIGYNNVNGKFYYFKRDPGSSNKQFISYNPNPIVPVNKYTTLAAFPGTNTIHSGCVNFSGSGYYCLDVNSNLYYYTILTNTWTFITNTFKDQFGNNITTVFQNLASGDMAVDGLNNLWFMPSDNTNYGLYELIAPLPTSGTASITLKQIIAPAALTPSGKMIMGLAFDLTGKIFFSNANGDLYKLPLSTATPTLVGNIPAGSMSDLTSCSYPLVVLPQTWTNFSASLKNGAAVELNWTVSQQADNKEMHIERSTDGVSWNVIGMVTNTGASAATYSYTDLYPAPEENYYRIGQVNYDGSETYSSIRTITPANHYKITMSPNPVSDVLNIQAGTLLNGSNNYILGFNLSGQVMFKSILHSGINKIDMHAYPTGSYLIQVHTQTGEIFNQKIIKN